MDEKTKEKFLKYEELKIEEKRIKAQIEELKPEIVEAMKSDEKINCRLGVIEMKKRDNWVYTEETVKMKEALKEKEKDEVAKGIAVNKPTFYAEYRSLGE